MLELCRCPNIYGPDCIYMLKAFAEGTLDFYFYHSIRTTYISMYLGIK